MPAPSLRRLELPSEGPQPAPEAASRAGPWGRWGRWRRRRVRGSAAGRPEGPRPSKASWLRAPSPRAQAGCGLPAGAHARPPPASPPAARRPPGSQSQWRAPVPPAVQLGPVDLDPRRPPRAPSPARRGTGLARRRVRSPSRPSSASCADEGLSGSSGRTCGCGWAPRGARTSGGRWGGTGWAGRRGASNYPSRSTRACARCRDLGRALGITLPGLSRAPGGQGRGGASGSFAGLPAGETQMPASRAIGLFLFFVFVNCSRSGSCPNPLVCPSRPSSPAPAAGAAHFLSRDPIPEFPGSSLLASKASDRKEAISLSGGQFAPGRLPSSTSPKRLGEPAAPGSSVPDPERGGEAARVPWRRAPGKG